MNPGFRAGVEFCVLDDMAQSTLRNDICDAVAGPMERYPDRWHTVIFLEDHMTPRSAELIGWPVVRGYAALSFTMPGLPLLYNGIELGIRKHPDLLVEAEPFDRSQADDRYFDLYRELIALRAASDALQRGDLELVPSRDHETLVYTRRFEHETVLSACNLSNRTPWVTIPIELAQRRWQEWQDGAFESGEGQHLPDRLELPVNGFRVWRSVGDASHEKLGMK
jgi:glycosidase